MVDSDRRFPDGLKDAVEKEVLAVQTVCCSMATALKNSEEFDRVVRRHLRTCRRSEHRGENGKGHRKA